jgi:sulfite reductase (NADPH) flavoprotein alpha-component
MSESTTEATPSAFNKKNPFPATMKKNRVLNKPGSGKDTRHFEISLVGSGLHYETGDSLGVVPKNNPALVELTIKAIGATGDEEVATPDNGPVAPLRQALLVNYELNKVSSNLLKIIAAKTQTPSLEALLKPENKKSLDEYSWGKDNVDLVQEHPEVKLTPTELISGLRKLQPRLYSIASSLKAHPEEVHLTVAAVRYESEGRQREGVCSTFLADRAEGNGQIPVFVHTAKHFRVPHDPAAPMMMVGPGTGIAPFRAFLEERRVTGAKGRNWLFFGDQKKSTDYLYEEEFTQMQQDGFLTRLDTAFSRDQAEKIYVQHRMIEQAKELWSWLDAGGCFYVCGDKNRMAADVDAALHKIVEEQGGKSADDAKAYVLEMKKSHRYARDVY